jgi:hypothetical protein
LQGVTGKAIVVTSWVTLGIFAVVAGLDAVGVSAIDTVANTVSLVLFLVSLPIWLYSFGLALVRSARGDDIAVGSWVFLKPSAPANVRHQLLGATGVCILVAAATAWANPFSVLVPMLQLGFAALWGARYGVYPARKATPARGGRA